MEKMIVAITRMSFTATARLHHRHHRLHSQLQEVEVREGLFALLPFYWRNPSFSVNALVVIFVLMPMSAILGIVGYIYLPQFLMRIRRGRYSEFRDLSEVS